MKHYSTLALIGFLLALCLGGLIAGITAIVPVDAWEKFQIYIAVVYFSLSGAYLFCFPAILRDILVRRHGWNDPRVRCIGVPIFGASLGLFVLGWIALLGPNELVSRYWTLYAGQT